MNRAPTILAPDVSKDPIPFVIDGEVSVLQVIAADPDDDTLLIFFPQGLDWLEVQPLAPVELGDGSLVWSRSAHVLARPELDGRVVTVTVTDGEDSAYINWQLEVP